jgi:hypothetical protein
VKYFEEHARRAEPDLLELLDRVLRTGVLALRTAGITVNLDLIERETQRMMVQIQRELDTRVSTITTALDKIFSKDGALAQALKQYLGEGGHLADFFRPERRDGAVGRIQTILTEHLGGEGSSIYKLLDPDNLDSPFRKFREDIKSDVGEIRTLLEGYRREIETGRAADQARAEVMERTAIKGSAYEELVFEAVNKIAATFGDIAAPTGDKLGLSGAKTGDIVITLNPRDTGGVDARLVVEAKDRPLGLAAISRELEAACQNRQGAAAIAVYSQTDHMPAGTAPLRDCGTNIYLCLLAKDCPEDTMAVQLAYRTARYWILKETIRTTAREIEPAKIRERLDDARKLLGAISSLKTQATQLKNAVNKGTEDLEGQLNKLRDGLLRIFDEIDAGLAGVGKGDDSPPS